jgi:hypothetical protein
MVHRQTCYNPHMEIKAKWKEHPLTKQGVVELVPTNWLHKIYGTNVSPPADLKDGTLVTMETLWENIVEEGLYDPAIIRVGVGNKKFRLESGNHRIQVFKKYGVAYTPATVHIQNECGPHVSNTMTDATHNFDYDDNVIVPQIKEGFLKPSQVFKDLHSQIKPF